MEDSSPKQTPADHLMGAQKKEPEQNVEKDPAEDYIIPDGGWGWLVTFCVFMIYLILDGSIFSFGVLYVELLDYFRESGAKTAIIGALLYGFPLLLAPFVCAFVIHGGFRVVGIIGAILVSTSFLLCAAAESIDYLTIVLGLLGSTGMEMGYVSAVLCITYYFDKYRGLATGLAMSGSGVGTFLFPPILDRLLLGYSWRGTCVLMSGICLHLLPCSLVFRPLTIKTKEDTSSEDKYEQFDKMIAENREIKLLSQRRMSKSLTHLPTQLNNSPSKLHCSDPALFKRELYSHHRHPIGYTNSFHHGGYALAFSMSSLNHKETVDYNETRLNTCSGRVIRAAQTLYDQTAKILRSSVDWSLLRDPGFMLFSFSNFLLCVYFGLPYLYIPHLAQISGIEEQKASFLISIMGITCTVSQIALGWIGDKTKASVHIYIICMLLSGGSLMLMPFYPGHYGIFCALCVLFGIGISGNYALTTLILIDLVGLEKLTVSFGMFQLQQGVASLIGTPIGGWIYDGTGNYFWAFMSGGICVFLSGIVLIPAPFIMKLKAKTNLAEGHGVIELTDV